MRSLTVTYSKNERYDFKEPCFRCMLYFISGFTHLKKKKKEYTSFFFFALGAKKKKIHLENLHVFSFHLILFSYISCIFYAQSVQLVRVLSSWFLLKIINSSHFLQAKAFVQVLPMFSVNSFLLNLLIAPPFQKRKKKKEKERKQHI